MRVSGGRIKDYGLLFEAFELKTRHEQIQTEFDNPTGRIEWNVFTLANRYHTGIVVLR